MHDVLLASLHEVIDRPSAARGAQLDGALAYLCGGVPYSALFGMSDEPGWTGRRFE